MRTIDDQHLATWHRRSLDTFMDLVRRVDAGKWSAPTPCTDWDVRDLVNHVVVEDLWTAPLVEGRTLEEVGDRFDGDQLGDDPVGAASAAVAGASAAVSQPGALQRTVHLSFGETPCTEYVWQLTADHLIHAWDLARAIGADEQLDPELVDAVSRWFADNEDLYRSAGAIGPRAEVTAEADAQARLLSGFGRTP